MSFAGRHPIFNHLDVPPSPMQRRLASLSRIFSQRRSRILIFTVAGLILAIAAVALLLKSRDTSSARLDDAQQPASALPVEAPPRTDTEMAQIWDRLEPAYKSYKIQVGNDNTLQTANNAVELYGAQIIPRTQVCRYLSGERWACGQRAYVALLNIFGGGTVDCRPQQINQPHIVICQLGGKDIAELMVREGWANVANGVTSQNFVDAAAAASSSKAGMYRQVSAGR